MLVAVKQARKSMEQQGQQWGRRGFIKKKRENGGKKHSGSKPVKTCLPLIPCWYYNLPYFVLVTHTQLEPHHLEIKIVHAYTQTQLHIDRHTHT